MFGTGTVTDSWDSGREESTHIFDLHDRVGGVVVWIYRKTGFGHVSVEVSRKYTSGIVQRQLKKYKFKEKPTKKI